MTTLEIFNVEHGQCALLTTDNGMRMMIDCGHSTVTHWYPGNYLSSLGISYLDMLVVTNYDQDCVFHAKWTPIPRQSGQSERSDAGVLV